MCVQMCLQQIWKQQMWILNDVKTKTHNTKKWEADSFHIINCIRTQTHGIS